MHAPANLEKMIIISFGATWLSRKASQGGRPVARVVSDVTTACSAGAEKAVGRGEHGLGERAALLKTRMSVQQSSDVVQSPPATSPASRHAESEHNEETASTLDDGDLPRAHFDSRPRHHRAVWSSARAEKCLQRPAPTRFLAARHSVRQKNFVPELVGAPRAIYFLASELAAPHASTSSRAERTRGTVAMGVAVPELKQCVPRPVFHSPFGVLAHRSVASRPRPRFPRPPVSRVPPLTSARSFPSAGTWTRSSG